MRQLLHYKIHFFLIVLFSWYNGVSKYRSESKANDTLALVGDAIITSQCFEQLYREKLLKHGINDNITMREGYLNNLVADELIIYQAKREKLDRTPEAVLEYKRIYIQELLNEYIKVHIAPSIVVTDEDLYDYFQKLHTKVKVRHLYARTREDAERLYDELKKGKSFEELAERTFQDPRLKKNAGSLGYISIDDMDPEFEKVAFTLKVGEISKPVRTVKGFSILQVEDIKRNPLITENEFLKSKERIRTFVHRRKFIETAQHFTASLRDSLQVTVNTKIVEKLYTLTTQGFNFEKSERKLSTEELNTRAIDSKIGSWNVRFLLRVLSETKENIRQWIHSKDDFCDFLIGLFNQRYLVNVAKEEKLDTSATFKTAVEYAFDSFLLKMYEEKLKSNIHISEDSLLQFYKNNVKLFQQQPVVRLRVLLVEDMFIADTIVKRLSAGDSFARLAEQYSIQRHTAVLGGDAGYFTKDELNGLDVDVFSLEVGRWFGPLTHDGKYLFLQCIEKKEARTLPFHEVKNDISSTLRELRWFQVRSQFVDSLKMNVRTLVNRDKLKTIQIQR